MATILCFPIKLNFHLYKISCLTHHSPRGLKWTNILSKNFPLKSCILEKKIINKKKYKYNYQRNTIARNTNANIFSKE